MALDDFWQTFLQELDALPNMEMGQLEVGCGCWFFFWGSGGDCTSTLQATPNFSKHLWMIILARPEREHLWMIILATPTRNRCTERSCSEPKIWQPQGSSRSPKNVSSRFLDYAVDVYFTMPQGGLLVLVGCGRPDYCPDGDDALFRKVAPNLSRQSNNPRAEHKRKSLGMRKPQLQ